MGNRAELASEGILIYLDYLAKRIGYDSYQAYLKSDHWKTFSNGIRKRRCYCCSTEKSILQVHHVTYERLGNELPCDVVTVCESCHVAIHKIASKPKSLRTAHRTYKRQITQSKRTQWVSWFRLLNKSKHQTLDDLVQFLMSKGLSDGCQATRRAFKLGFVRLENGKEKWSRREYVKLLQADKKVKKRERQGKKVANADYERALICKESIGRWTFFNRSDEERALDRELSEILAV